MLTGDKKRPDGLQIDLTQAETILCEKCGNGLFCLLYTSPSPRDAHESRMPSSA